MGLPSPIKTVSGASAPVNVKRPHVYTVGGVVHCIGDTWQRIDFIRTYQWKADGVNISGATQFSYTLTIDEAGKTMTCELTVTNRAGSTTVLTE